MIGLLLAALAQDTLPPPRVVDDFTSVAPWHAAAPEGVEARVTAAPGRTGGALRLEYRFHGAGYAIARRELPLTFPANYTLSFWLRSDGPPNTLEVKFVDASGENVWWYTERDRHFTGGWERITIRKRQVSFAWGPTPGPLTRSAALELVITAGAGGGSGTVFFDDLVLTPLPELGPYDRTPVASASAGAPGAGPARLLDGDTSTAWRAPAGPTPVSVTLDFQRLREFGGLAVRWDGNAAARDYDVELSDDARTWRTAHRVRGGNSGVDHLFLPESEAVGLRLVLRRPVAGATTYAIRELTVEPLAAGASRNAFMERVAATAPRGAYPRYFSAERPSWTVVGVDGAAEEVLVGEEGAVEAGKGLFSVMPFLEQGGRVLTWADARLTPSLAEGDLPVPTVRWEVGSLVFDVTTFAVGPASASSAVVRYLVRNTGPARSRPTLHLAVRPFQVNPSSQFLNTPGGVARIDSLAWSGRALRVNGNRTLLPTPRPARLLAGAFDGGEIGERLLAGAGRGPGLPGSRPFVRRDGFGMASAALSYPLLLGPGDSAAIYLEIPLTPGGRANLPQGDAARFEAARAEVTGAWAETVDRVGITLPPAAEALAQSIRATQAWVLINRDGPAIQPGSRSYERSWIRDGALTSSAMLRFGHPEVVRDFLRWFAPQVYANGKVPCCIDHRGADPTPEHDSHGEFLWLLMEYWRHTGDTALLRETWPVARRTVAYMDSLRGARLTPAYAGTEFEGLLPPSISHEGYSAKPMHSYWDDFFAYRGYRDAVAMARALGQDSVAARWQAAADSFGRAITMTVARTMARHAIDYVPGAADLGDFDATSTTVALTPTGAEALLPREALEATFDRYYRTASARRDPASAWEAYTPYELRTVGSLLRLGRREQALAMLDQFLEDQEPPAWRQWPEVVWKDRRAPKFIGDLPHTWVGSDFLRAAADLFAWEREGDSALVLGMGLRAAWTADGGTAVRGLRTWWGPVSYTARREGDFVSFTLAAGTRVPAGGLVVYPPVGLMPRRVFVDDQPVAPGAAGEVTVRRLPAVVRFQD